MAATTETKEIGRNRSNIFANGTFWTAMAILIMLFLFSLVILSVHLYNFATIDERVLSIKSNAETRFNVVSLEYSNETGEVTVIGADGEKVIAPGTNVEYTVRLRNADKTALDYEILPRADFHSEYTIPVLVRVIGPNETYVAGGADRWITLEELNGASARSTLLKGEAVEYLFQWKWPFESGDDDYDAFLGNKVHDETIGVTISFETYATANTTLDVNGGAFGNVYGNTALLIIFVILLLAAIIVLLISKLSGKRREDEPTSPDGNE